MLIAGNNNNFGRWMDFSVCLCIILVLLVNLHFVTDGPAGFLNEVEYQYFLFLSKHSSDNFFF